MAGSNFYCIDACSMVVHNAGVGPRQLWGLSKLLTLSDPIPVYVKWDAQCGFHILRAWPMMSVLGPGLTHTPRWLVLVLFFFELPVGALCTV